MNFSNKLGTGKNMKRISSEAALKILKEYRNEDDVLAIIFRSYLNATNALKNCKTNIFGVQTEKLEDMGGVKVKSYKAKTTLSSKSFEIQEKNRLTKSCTKILVRGQFLFFEQTTKEKGEVSKIEASIVIDERLNYVRFEELKLYNYHKEYKELKNRNKAFLARRSKLMAEKNALI